MNRIGSRRDDGFVDCIQIVWYIQGMIHKVHIVDLDSKSIPAWLQLQVQVDKFSYWKTSRCQQHGELLLMIGQLNYYSCQYILTTSSPKSSHWKATLWCYFCRFQPWEEKWNHAKWPGNSSNKGKEVILSTRQH